MAEAITEESRVTADSPHHLPPRDDLRILWQGGSIKLDGSPVGVGANYSNAIVIDCRFVSGFHCRIYFEKGHHRVRDLGSTNGTCLDGMRVVDAELLDGARLKIGTHELRVEREIAKQAAKPLPGLVARDPALAPVLELLRKAAPSMLPLMLLGESGTGKEVAAKAVHELSTRSQGPFVPVNCGAIAPELAEAELFGHEKGSFTGAIHSAPGAFGAADGGTLFLDEIGDLPLNLQVKLLRALEAGEVKPVGAPRPRPIDVRVICATHHDLAKRVREGEFREDLYYRLRGVTVELPPLRSRPRDIVPLAEHFLEKRKILAADARAALVAHRWPGNVRELRHVIHLACVLNDGPVLRSTSLHFGGSPNASWNPRCAETIESIEPERVDLRGRTLGELEELAIRSSLNRHEGNRRRVMEELGIARTSLLRKLKQLKL
jgi:two-component system response regulator HydG